MSDQCLTLEINRPVRNHKKKTMWKNDENWNAAKRAAFKHRKEKISRQMAQQLMDDEDYDYDY